MQVTSPPLLLTAGSHRTRNTAATALRQAETEQDESKLDQALISIAGDPHATPSERGFADFAHDAAFRSQWGKVAQTIRSVALGALARGIAGPQHAALGGIAENILSELETAPCVATGTVCLDALKACAPHADAAAVAAVAAGIGARRMASTAAASLQSQAIKWVTACSQDAPPPMRAERALAKFGQNICDAKAFDDNTVLAIGHDLLTEIANRTDEESVRQVTTDARRVIQPLDEASRPFLRGVFQNVARGTESRIADVVAASAQVQAQAPYKLLLTLPKGMTNLWRQGSHDWMDPLLAKIDGETADGTNGPSNTTSREALRLACAQSVQSWVAQAVRSADGHVQSHAAQARAAETRVQQVAARERRVTRGHALKALAGLVLGGGVIGLLTLVTDVKIGLTLLVTGTVGIGCGLVSGLTAVKHAMNRPTQAERGAILAHKQALQTLQSSQRTLSEMREIEKAVDRLTKNDATTDHNSRDEIPS